MARPKPGRSKRGLAAAAKYRIEQRERGSQDRDYAGERMASFEAEGRDLYTGKRLGLLALLRKRLR